jgi:hypothetical protein
MPLEFPMKRVGHTLVLSSPAYEEDFLRIPENQDLTVPRPRRNRSLQQNNYLHAVLSELLKGGVFDGSLDQFKDFLKMKMNWGRWYPSSDGKAIFVPNHQPDEKQEYTEYIDKMFEAIIRFTGIDPNTLDEICNRKKQQEGEMEADLENRLLALAAALDLDSTAAMNEKWELLRQQTSIRQLHATHPQAVKNIVTACRAFARGRYSREQLNDSVEKSIQEALAQP